MAVSRKGRVSGRDGGEPVTGGARGNARRPPAVCRRCKGGSGQPGDVRRPRALRPLPLSAPDRHLARHAYLARDHAPDGARRAPRALDR
jgi:hypothetical protein